MVISIVLLCAPVNVVLQILYGAEEDLQQQGRLANFEYKVSKTKSPSKFVKYRNRQGNRILSYDSKNKHFKPL
jgi:hypothetical protein